MFYHISVYCCNVQYKLETSVYNLRLHAFSFIAMSHERINNCKKGELMEREREGQTEQTSK